MYESRERCVAALSRQGQSCLALDAGQPGWLLPTHTPQYELSGAGPGAVHARSRPEAGRANPQWSLGQLNVHTEAWQKVCPHRH